MEKNKENKKEFIKVSLAIDFLLTRHLKYATTHPKVEKVLERLGEISDFYDKIPMKLDEEEQLLDELFDELLAINVDDLKTQEEKDL